MKNINVNVGSINIRVDFRTELLGIIEIISNYKDKYSSLLEKHGNKDYVEEIIFKFERFNNHKTIELFNYLVNKYEFSYDAPIALFLELDDNLKCNNLSDYVFKKRLKGDKKAFDFIDLLPEFTKEINFEEFYQSNRQRYEKFIKKISDDIKKYNCLDFMLDYYGVKPIKEFIVNLLPFQTRGNYGTNNTNGVYANICCSNNGITEDEVFNGSAFGLSCLLFHEFSHSFINPLTDEFNLIDKKSTIFNEIKEIMKKQAYEGNETIINEHIIRALIMRYLVFCKNYQKENVEYEKKLGFIYIENIIDSLITYENNRTTYKTIHDYYPIIIENIMREYMESKKDDKN